MKKVPVAIVILTHRNDERLAMCLNSCNFAQEVIVLDYLSGVAWQPWLKKLPLTVIPKKDQLRDFAQAREEGLLLAECEWVLFLDSDEVLLESAASQISECLSSEDVNGYWLRRRDMFYGQEMKHGEVGTVWLLRLMRRTHSRFERPVHEIATIDGPTEHSDIIIHHFAHPSLAEFMAKVSLYAAMEAQFRPTYSLAKILVEMLFFPPAKFVVNYLFRLGFLDGWRGVIYAFMMSLHSLLVRVFAYEKTIRT